MPEPPPTHRIHAAAQRIRAFDARHPSLWDVGLACLVAFPGFVQLTLGEWREDSPEGSGADSAELASVPMAVPWLLQVGMVLTLPWRRRYPFAMFCGVAALTFVHDAYHLALASVMAIGVALYNVALRLPLSRLLWVAAIIAAEIGAEVLRDPPENVARAYVPVVAIVATIVMGGITTRTRREYVASLLDRAERLEVERDQRARLAAAAERARIAREMHDIVAHNLSVIVGLADGGAYAARGGRTARSAERPAQALEAISATGREALGELRRLLGVLHEQGPGPGPAHLAPQPGLAELEPLLQRVREAGLPVRCTVRGDSGTLSEGRQLTVYRIVQEALTNTLKHAGGGATAAVRLDCAAGGAEIEVTDTGAPSGRGGGDQGGSAGGRGRREPEAATGGGSAGEETSSHGAESTDGPAGRAAAGGRGIAGMRERASVYDGTLSASPAPGGGWRVRATLPPPANPAPADGHHRRRPASRILSPSAAPDLPDPVPPRNSPSAPGSPAPPGRPPAPGSPPEATP
ncbi:sensor histidine kinase [Streptomyces synnematoformans]|uniref:sensor histidine kinase n=1 Tax=Streptomyces synnematoformans TaxID=415721 RepID=UPI0031CF13B0